MWFSKRRGIRAIIGGLICCLLLSMGGVYGQAATLRDTVVRLHILAHSDTTADQTIKLQVRDAITRAAAHWSPQNPTDLRENLGQLLPHLQTVAQQTVRQAGSDAAVTVEQTRMYFTTRRYDDVTLPAGMYDTVQITIGAGLGQNWWCVVYPPMCVGGATDRDALNQVLGPYGSDLADGGQRYVLRFKLLEWVESFLQLFR